MAQSHFVRSTYTKSHGSHSGTLSSTYPIIPSHLSKALPVFSHIRNLSSEVKILGDSPVAEGVLSSIWLGELISTRQQVAVKLLVPSTSKGDPQVFFKELYMWSHAVPHEHVIPLLGIARLKDSIAFISPWMPGGNLDAQLADCSIPERLRILVEIASALAHLHHKNIVYINLLLSTIVLDQTKKAYLSSFLFAQTDWSELSKIDSQLFPDEPSSLSVYTTYRHKAQPKDDVSAFGLLVVSMLFNKGLPTWPKHNLLIKQILLKKFNNIDLGSPDIPEDIWTIVQACWEGDSTKRPTMDQISTELSNILKLLPINESSHVNPNTNPRPLKDISPEIKKIGQYPVDGGGYCDLYLGERLGREKVALKLVRLFGSTDQDKETARRRFMAEARIWAGLYHHRILEFYGICEYGSSIYMVSPFLENGNIMHYLNHVNPSANRKKLTVSPFMQLVETAEGLAYLHNRNSPVIHGDLKGGNILISNAGTALLADFGLSRISHEVTTSILHGAGSSRWMAPELTTADDTLVGPLRTIQSDVYGYGHIMLEVLSNQKPFFNLKDELHVIVELIHGRRPARPTGPIASQWLDDTSWEFCQHCTAIDPAMRPSMNDVLSHLQRIFNL